MDFLRKPLKLLVFCFIFLAFFSHSTVAKKIVIISDDISIDKVSTPATTYTKTPQTAYETDSQGYIIVTPGMDMSSLQTEKIQRNVIWTPSPRETEQNQSSVHYSFTEKISDTSLLTQRSIESCQELVNDTLSLIPSEQYSGLTTIELIYDKSAKRGGANAKKISIRCNDISDSEFKAVFIHELGHIVDGSYLSGTSSLNSDFVDLGNPVRANDPSVDYYSLSWENDTQKKANSNTSDFCSIYGATDPYEDFAECYIFYVLQPSQFEKNSQNSEILKKKLEFIKNIVFKGEQILKTSKLFAKSQVYDNTKLSHSF